MKKKFMLPKEIKKGIEKYRASLKELAEGKISPARFKGIRVPWGVYSHRGGSVYMTRVRVPAGVVSPKQLRVLASASKKYGNGMLHITTRQDIQIHEVKIEETAYVMDMLKTEDLSSRGGGGNTVRNVIACSCAGVCPTEMFDVSGSAIALTEHLMRQPSSFSLPRKFKVAFSGCAKDCAGCLVNDIGFLSIQKDGENGFKVFAGGGMGAHARIGKTLEEYLPVDEAGYCVTAVRNIFYRMGDRRNKHHNRLRFLIEDMGFDVFKEHYKKEFAELKEREHIVLREIESVHEREAAGTAARCGDPLFDIFMKYNVRPQKQKGFYAVTLRIPRGDINADTLLSLSEFENDFPGIEFRTTQNQDLLICWVRSGDLARFFEKLRNTIEDFLYPDTLLDVVACKGALTCNLGLCNSPGLAKEIESLVKDEFIGTKVFDMLEIKMNGCPNACGHQPIGKLSFYGVIKKIDNRPVPFYNFLIGGRKEAQKTKLAVLACTIPARNVPVFLRSFLREINEEAGKRDDVYGVLAGAAAIAKRIAEKYAYVPPYAENRDFYIDWGRSEEFSLAGIGPGECGAGVLDMIDSDLTDAQIALDASARSAFNVSDIKKALYLSARALLVVKGKEPKSVDGIFEDFVNVFIGGGIASGAFKDIAKRYRMLDESVQPGIKKEIFSYAKEYLEHVRAIYKSMDATLNFPKTEKAPSLDAGAEKKIDLKGTPCPINYVKAKLVIESLASGAILEILLDDGEPIENVPKSLESDGHRILKKEKTENYWRLVVKKK